MRVLLVNTSFPPFVFGGAELSVQELAEDLAAAGHEVRVLCLAPRSRLSAPSDNRERQYPSNPFVRRLWRRRLHPDGRSPSVWARVLWHLGELARLREYRELRAEIGRHPDVVHLNNIAGFGWLSWWAVRDVPSVLTVRDYALVCTSSFGEHDGELCSRTRPRCAVLKAPFSLPLLRPDRVVAVSAYVADRMETAGIRGRQGGNLVVPNAPRMTAEAVRAPRLRADAPFVIGFLGRLDADKGLSLLHDAVRLLRMAGTDGRLVVAGSPTRLSARLRELFAAEYADGSMEQIGHVSPAELFTRCDVLAVPTQWQEPFSRTAAEGLCAGVTVVGSASGGIPELARLYGGRLITVPHFRDARAWAHALADVAAHSDAEPAPRRRPSAPADAYLEIYDDVRRGRQISRAGSVVGRAQANSRQS